MTYFSPCRLHGESIDESLQAPREEEDWKEAALQPAALAQEQG